MKGTTRTRAEIAYHSKVAELGCVACRIDGWINKHVSIHHVEGRTKKGCHYRVLPLCAGHHQDGTGIDGLVAVHPYKTAFESKYGRQSDLIDYVLELLR